MCKGEGGVGLIGQREGGGWIRVQFHVALFGHALPAVDVPDAIREVLPYVLEVHWLSVRVVRGGASTHLCPLGFSLDWSGVRGLSGGREGGGREEGGRREGGGREEGGEWWEGGRGVVGGREGSGGREGGRGVVGGREGSGGREGVKQRLGYNYLVISAHVAWMFLLVCYFISFAYTYYTTRVHVHASYM